MSRNELQTLGFVALVLIAVWLVFPSGSECRHDLDNRDRFGNPAKVCK